MVNRILKPKEVADLIGIKVDELVDTDVERISADSLNKMSRLNPEKYQLQMLGLVCKKLGVTIEEIVLYSKQREEIIQIIKKRDKSL